MAAKICKAASEQTTTLLEQLPLNRRDQNGKRLVLTHITMSGENQTQHIRIKASHRLSAWWWRADDLANAFYSHGPLDTLQLSSPL